MIPIDQQSNEGYAIHSCGYDSLLHAKICSTNNIITSPMPLHNYNAQQNSTNSMPNCNNYRNSRTRHRHHNEFSMSASPQVQGYTKLMSTQQNSKLNTALLNQLNPQLTHEQKLTRTISDVERWLADDQIVAATSNGTATNSTFEKDNSLHKDVPACLKNMNVNNSSDKFKENEIETNKYNNVRLPSKKVFNKNILLTRPKSSSSQQNSSNSDSPNGKAGTFGMTAPPNKCIAESEENIVQYASIPIVDASHSECEILLRASSDENESISQIGTIHHRYVHIHHHYYHH